MILQQLYDDSAAILRDSPTPPMYDNILVQWEIQITTDGEFSGLIYLGDKGGVRHCVPYNYGRSSDIVPNLLVDTADYALGILDKNAAKKHEAFLGLLKECIEATHNPLVLAVERFLKAGGIPLAKLDKNLKAKDRVMFTVGGKPPVDEADVQQYWDELTQWSCKGERKHEGQCLITGADGYVESVLPCEIRVDGESAPLISVNEAAGNSYGFKQALNSPVSRNAAEGFTKALNWLMRTPSTRISVSGITYVFWNRRGGDVDTVKLLTRPEENVELVHKLFNSLGNPKDRVARRVGRRLQKDFFILAISGNKTRVVFREWLALAGWEKDYHIHAWFSAQQIVQPNGDYNPEKLYGVDQLATAMVREPKDKRGIDVEALIRVALTGEAVPRRVLAAVLRRCYLEPRVPDWLAHIRAALIKLVRTLNDEEMMRKMATLDHLDELGKGNPSYVCGRLMACLEQLQYDALGGNVNSNIVDRYFSAAAAEPKRILGTVLLQKARVAYLAKMRRQKHPGYFNRKDEIESLVAQISPQLGDSASGFPAKQSLEQQADFQLGYYHQSAKYRKDSKDRKNAKGDNNNGE